MIYKFLLYPVCICFLFGCGENYSAGVIQGGSGNGKPTTPKNGREGDPEPLAHYYIIKLSEPKIDYCQGIKRTLQFLNPLNNEIVEKEQLLEISSQDEIDNQILVQIIWENQSEQMKTVFKPSCDTLVTIKGLENAETTNRIPQCDIEKVTTLGTNTLHITNQVFKFDYTFKGNITHSNNVEFLPTEGKSSSCNSLEINFDITNN